MQPTEPGPRRQRGAASRPASRSAVIGSGFVAVGGTISALVRANAPWWAIALVAIVLAAMGGVVALAQLVLPQNSRDRLDWWRDLRSHRARRSRVPPAVHVHPQVRQHRTRGCTILYGSRRLRIPRPRHRHSSQCDVLPKCPLPALGQAAEHVHVTSTPDTADHDGSAATELGGREWPSTTGDRPRRLPGQSGGSC